MPDEVLIPIFPKYIKYLPFKLIFFLKVENFIYLINPDILFNYSYAHNI